MYGVDHLLWRRVAILLVLCLALAAIASTEELHSALIHLLDAVEEVIGRHPVTGAVLFVGLAAVSAMFTFVSIAIIVPAVVFAWGEPASLLLLWMGWILGGVCTYGIGRFIGRPIVRRLTTNPALSRLEHQLKRDTPFWLVLLLQLALPSEIPGYVLGLAGYPFMRYVLALGLAELPYTFATVYLGTSFLEQRGDLILVIGIAIVLLSVGTFMVLHHATRPDDSRARQ